MSRRSKRYATTDGMRGTGALPEARDPTAPAVLADAPALRAAVLGWYDRRGRTLPFRGATDPWAILVSEAMAQQTQAARAGQAWRAFMSAYPTPATLAVASPADALRAWRGLGYNRRAVALHAAATAIVRDHAGRVPDDLAQLQRLPGVGGYTARAVAALGFGHPVGAVDTNVRRVLGRLVGADPGLTVGPLQRLADTLVDPERPGDWTHALMDVGATICRPRRADCDACPLRPECRTAAGRRAGEPLPEGAGRSGRASAMPGRAAHEVRVAYGSTARWLRGRIVERLRDATADEWVRFDGHIGEHGPEAIVAALNGLERDGLLERHANDERLVRLPTTVSGARAPR